MVGRNLKLLRADTVRRSVAGINCDIKSFDYCNLNAPDIFNECLVTVFNLYASFFSSFTVLTEIRCHDPGLLLLFVV